MQTMAKSETESGNRCKVLLVEDHPMFREHLSQLISRDLGMSICGEADNIRDAMRLIREKQPDIAIVDITLRGSSGLELLKDIKAQGLNVNVLVLSMHDEELYAERALRAGAKGYITKNEASSEVVKAIRCVMGGEVYASRQVTAKLLERLTQKRAAPELAGMDTLADRELEVFQMLGRGKSTREIAQSLHLGESTVETYRARIKDKLQLRSAAELYLRAGQWVRDHGA
jgi:DNA-binding NarL/FixJ family response regulator